VSRVDLKFVDRCKACKDEISGAVRRAREQPLKGALGFTDQPTSRSTSITMPLLHLPHGPEQNLVPSWCGNEWGFSNRMADIAVRWAS
jgi:glyceraldehyde 3-phosphate dehydrogenase